ncbi:hypothetical protein [Ferrimonas balearica]|uniref:hypothetical protein n=1 Tax=Ferrimonas balearica TaxID=44012 RepID=UPI001C9902BA|nr:hypothetical protein [Ferrimonas balearica]MBY5990975.1 hypothetical protein [Ferrimonas balearica]
MTTLHRVKMITKVSKASTRSNFSPNCTPEADPLHDTHCMHEQGRTHRLCKLLNVRYDKQSLIHSHK